LIANVNQFHGASFSLRFYLFSSASLPSD